MVTITKELLEDWNILSTIPEELLPIEVAQLFEASIPTANKVQVLLHEEILGRRGMVYVAARAARRDCTRIGWNHPDSLRALDLCDRYASGEEIPEKELKSASNAASNAASRACGAASNAACWPACGAASANSRIASWAAFNAASWAASASNGSSEAESEAQLNDCREWFLRGSSKERAPVLNRYQRILRATW